VLICVLLIGAVALYSLYTLFIGTTYTSCEGDVCGDVSVPIPIAAVPAGLAGMALVGVIARWFFVCWVGVIGLLVFGFLSGFSIGGPIFLGALLSVPFVALAQSDQAARNTALYLSLAIVGIGVIVLAFTIASPPSSVLPILVGTGAALLGAVVAVGILIRSAAIAWFGVIVAIVVLLPFLPLSILFLSVPVSLALLLRPALRRASPA
jgi:hypothetical protein